MQRLLVAAMPGRDLVLSVMRIVIGLCYLQHGLSKLAGFPASRSPAPEIFSLIWYAGAIEVVCGTLLVIGLLTRPAAFVACGQVAFAYFIAHFPRDAIPLVNGGTLLVAYCFAFLYLTVAGPGALSLDRLLFARRDAPLPDDVAVAAE